MRSVVLRDENHDGESTIEYIAVLRKRTKNDEWARYEAVTCKSYDYALEQCKLWQSVHHSSSDYSWGVYRRRSILVKVSVDV